MVMDELEESDMMKSFLNSLETFSNSSAQLAEIADRMPAEVREQMTVLLEEMEAAQSTLQETLRLSKDTSTDIRQTVDKVIHRTTPHGGNELRLIKRLEEDSEDHDISDRKRDCSA